MKDKITVNFSLVDFKIISSEFLQPPSKLKISSKGNFLINTNLDIDPKVDEVYVYIDVKSNIFYRNKEKPIGKMRTRTTFKFEELKKFLKDDKIHFPQPLMETIYSIAYSTTRGAFDTAGKTVLDKNPLMPIVDLKKLLPPRVKVNK